MNKTLCVLTLLLLAALPSVASATMIKIHAESKHPGLYSGWEMTAHDSNGNLYLGAREVSGFSGLSILGQHYDNVFFLVFDLTHHHMVLKVKDEDGHRRVLLGAMFHITVKDAKAVAEPGALALMGLGLIGLALRRRRSSPAL